MRLNLILLSFFCCQISIAGENSTSHDKIAAGPSQDHPAVEGVALSNPSEECFLYAASIQKRYPSKEVLQQLTSPHLSKSFSWENDSFYPPDASDRQYTNGMQMRWIHNPCNQQVNYRKKATKKIIDTLFKGSEFHIFTGGFFGISMFTPEDISIASRINSDRPYSGYAYFGLSSIFSPIPQPEINGAGSFANTVHNINLQIGLIGPAAGQEYAQTFIHDEITGSTIPEGWDNQIDNQFSIFAGYTYRKDWTDSFVQSDSTNHLIRPLTHIGFGIGSFVNYFNLGGMLVVGNSQNSFPSLSIQPTASVGEMSGKHKRPFYAYIGTDVRVYANNLLVEGEDESAHSIELVHVVGDAIAGVSIPLVYPMKWVGLDCKCNLNYQIVRRSKEFESSITAADNPHTFGRFEIQWGIP